MNNTPLNLSPYLSQEKIQDRVKEIGEALNKQFVGREAVAICVLKGSFVFFSDLMRTLDFPVTVEFFGVSSYQGATSSGEIKVTLDLNRPMENQNVILVEDIVDTGLTMNYLKSSLLARKPASLTTVSLLAKPDCLRVPCEVDHVGFKIPNDFVVGYGLDYQGHYRNLPYIAQIQSFN